MLILVIDDDGDSTFTFKLSSEDDDGHRSPLMELEYRTPSTRSLNSLLHELQNTYIILSYILQQPLL